MHNTIEEFNIDKWSDEMMQIFERRNKTTYILVGTPRQEGKSLFWKRYQEAIKESQGKIEVIEFDTEPSISEAQFKSKVLEMNRRVGKTPQPIYDEFSLETKEIMSEIKDKGLYRKFEKKNKKGLK